ncbi:hypothetical protein Athai_18670 [Actinocatenispora thailandica]|uniref:Nitroreductase n=1 Tax=Actinocatenispora thailandica TaxID=227318 RepID=A0A7R7DMD8_9ACTN|nr:nitroreductase [Actinocatenispora thailandica]BCJ34364.1 hypothetical protein Athai_18670 [Actinocatenispora thailandica]
MSELRDLLRRAERDLQRGPRGAEHSDPARLWRELVELRERAAHTEDEPRLIGAARQLAERAAGVAAGPAVSAETLVGTIASAILAPSMHNSQPWRFAVGTGRIEVRLDPERRLPVADPDGVAARIACGAALHNLRLAFPVRLGRAADVAALPDPADPELLAVVRPGVARPAAPREQALHAAIARRHSNRYPFRDDLPVDPALHATLTEAARTRGCWLDLVVEPATRRMLGELITDADRVLRADPAYEQEVSRWIRRDAGATDGIPGRAAGPRPEPGDLLPGRDYGGAPRRPDRGFEPAPLVAVLGGPGEHPADQVAVGEALQAVLLAGTDAGLAASLYSQALEVPEARSRLRRMSGRLGSPYLVLRIGYPSRPMFATPRRPVPDVTDLL